MISINNNKKKYFYVVGISYKKADATVRGLFSIEEEKQHELLKKAKEDGFSGLTIISTCNRTELYGFAEHPYLLIEKMCGYSKANAEDFDKYGYIYKSKEAINHIFNVGTGLDSQILGDFEIIGQLKKAFLLSKEYGLLDAYMDRLQNAVIQASKRVKNETELSSGATSVAFASVRYMFENVDNIEDKNILLFGTGKIGRNTCENLNKHLKSNKITVINRTKEKAKEIGERFGFVVKDYYDLRDEIRNSDILIVATGADSPTVTVDMIPEGREMLILDLSIPSNVHSDVADKEGVRHINVDHLSQMTDQTLDNRKMFIPVANKIIDEVKGDFEKWVENRQFVPAISMIKSNLEKIRDNEIDFQRKKIDNFNEEQANLVTSRLIQKVTTLFMNHLKETNMVDESLEMIEQVFGKEN